MTTNRLEDDIRSLEKALNDQANERTRHMEQEANKQQALLIQECKQLGKPLDFIQRQIQDQEQFVANLRE